LDDYFDGMEMGDINKDKILAVIALNISDRFYDEWEHFENICEAFNSKRVDTGTLTPLLSEEITWGIVEACLNDDTPKSFSYDVQAYIDTCFKVEGVSTCPEFISHLCKYKSYNEFDKDIETVKQARIKSYVLMKTEELITLSREYFMRDIRKDLAEEIPGIEKFIRM
jgi:hypothetical protein